MIRRRLVTVAGVLCIGVAGTGALRHAGLEPPKKPKPGHLATHVDQLLKTPGAFRQETEFVTTDKATPTPVKLAPKWGCTAGTLDMTVTAADNSHGLELPADLDNFKHGFVVAKIVNRTGSCVPVAIPLAVGDTAYWVIEKDGNNYRSLMVDVNPNQEILLTSPAWSGWTAAECSVDPHDNTADNAMVRSRSSECDHPIVQPTFHGVDKNRRHRRDPDDPSLWFACAANCCYADMLVR